MPKPPFYLLSTGTHLGELVLRVSDLIDVGSKTWKTALVKECFNKEDSELILSIPISSTQRRDRKIWHSSSDGHFIVKSAYHLDKESSIVRPENLVAQSSSTAMMSSIWKRLSIQPEIKLSAFNGALATNSALAGRKIRTEFMRSLCGKAEASICHLLFQCDLATRIWIHSPFRLKIRGASRLSSHNRLVDLHPRTHSASRFSLFDYGSGVGVLLVNLACEKQLCV